MNRQEIQEKVVQSRPEIEERFGAWMLAPKKSYRQHNPFVGSKKVKNGFTKNDINRAMLNTQGNKGIQFGNTKQTNQHNSTGSRFEILRGLAKEDNMESCDQTINANAEGNMKTNKGARKPNHKGKGKRSNVQVSEKQILNNEHSTIVFEQAPAKEHYKSLHEASTSRSQKPKQAAAEDRHIVVRGSRKDKHPVREIVDNNSDENLSQSMLDLQTLEHYGDPSNQGQMLIDEEPWQDCSDGLINGGTPEGDAT
nr:uncharacterized protein LOC109162703 [Ipomoea batatas]GME19542.1 uncharacterized protein LOC109162703 [Ipomoea batatas]